MEVAATHLDDQTAGAGALMRAIFVYKDNHGAEVFTQLRTRQVVICFAAPETFLHNKHFIRHFWSEKQRTAIPGVWIDEAQIIPEWMEEFWKSYGQLDTLHVVLCSQVPFGAASATLAMANFKVLFKALHHSSRKLCWLLGTNAAGMGLNIPDIMQSVIFGAHRSSAAFQEGGPAVRDPQLSGAMIWLVPTWMFWDAHNTKDTWEDIKETEETGDAGVDSNKEDGEEPVQKATDEEHSQELVSAKKNWVRHTAFDSAAIKFVNLASSNMCMQPFALEHCQLSLMLLGFLDRLLLKQSSKGVDDTDQQGRNI
jgi:superfamily II DNA helicase RecQ